QLVDLNRAIEYGEQAVQLTPETHSWKPAHLSNLGLSYQSRFEHSGELSDLDKAIDCHSRAVSLVPEGHQDRAIWLNNLGTSYSIRFKHLGQLADLNKAIEYHQQALVLTPEKNPDKPTWLNNLGASYASRFGYLGQLEDLDHAVNVLGQAISLTAEGDSHKPAWLNNLGASYLTRFEHLGDQMDLDMAINFHCQALSLTPDGHQSKPKFLGGLGVCYHRRFELLKQPTDLNKAIDNVSEAISLTPEGHSDKPKYLNNLSSAYRLRFLHLQQLKDLDKAIDCMNQANLLTPEGQLDNYLGILHRERFEHLGELVDLNKAIEYGRKAVECTPGEHPHQPVGLIELSQAYYRQFQKLGDQNSLRLAITYAKQAALMPTSGVAEIKFQAARMWADLCLWDDRSASLEAYQQAFSLIPEVVWLGSTADGRYKNVPLIDNLAMEAAVTAVISERFDLALEWLEEGRAVVWSQLLQLRDPFDEVSSIDLSLATELKQTARDLEYTSSFVSTPSRLTLDRSTSEQAAQRHRRLAEKWDKLVKRARLLPGMRDFLRVKSSPGLIAAAGTGTVVVVNIDRRTCFALVIRAYDTDMSHLSGLTLKTFTYSKAAQARVQLTQALRNQGRTARGVIYPSKVEESIEEILKMLWTDVAKPVLDYLGYT
ncbi:hypothetical protein FRC06_010357, partial [Ceratobasidium sp. 370]